MRICNINSIEYIDEFNEINNLNKILFFVMQVLVNVVLLKFERVLLEEERQVFLDECFFFGDILKGGILKQEDVNIEVEIFFRYLYEKIEEDNDIFIGLDG